MYSINPALHSRAHRQFRGDSGPTHRFGPSGTHTHWLPAIREWHSVSGTLDRVFESLRSQPSHQVGCTSTIRAVAGGVVVFRRRACDNVLQVVRATRLHSSV